MHENSLNKNKFKNLLYLSSPDFFAILVLLISGFVYVYDTDKILDILDFDESMYLHWGVIFPSGFPVPDWSPFYVLWYYFLNLFQQDTIQLYFLNYILMTVIPPLFIYIFLRVNKVQIIVSYTVSLLFLLSFANFPTTPKVSHFALLFLLFGMIISSKISDKKLKILIFSMILLLTSYIRPEFFISFLLVSAVLSVIYLKELFSKYSFKSALPFISSALLSVLILFVLGLPVGSGERSFIAFGQHYSRNWVKWHNDPREPYANYKVIMEEDFGNLNTIQEVILQYPYGFMNHLLENIRNLPQELVYMFMTLYPYSYPRTFELILSVILFVISLSAFFLIGKKSNHRSILKGIHDNIRFYKVFYLILLTALMPMILSSILIFPRRHYLIIFGVILILMFVCILFRNVFIPRKQFIYISIIYVFIFSLLLVRPLKSIVSIQAPENLRTIKFIRSLEIKEPVNILDAAGLYNIYESNNYNRVQEYAKVSLFNEYLRETSVNMIVLSNTLLNDNRFSNDPEWNYFIKYPEEFGFACITVPEVKEIKLLIKKDILK